MLILYQRSVKNSYYEKIGEDIVCIDDDIPFEIPDSWSWARLESIGLIKSGVTYPAEQEQIVGEKMYVKIGDMNLKDNLYEIQTSTRYLNEYKTEHLIPKRSVIFPKRGGAIATNKKRLVLNDSILIDLNTMGITPNAQIEIMYFYYWFIGIDLSKLYNGTSIPQINNCDIAPLFIPIPPKKEQILIANAISTVFSIVSEIEKSLK